MPATLPIRERNYGLRIVSAGSAMADASSARMAHVAALTTLVRFAHAEVTKRHGAYTVLRHVGYCGPGDGLYMDLHMRLKQVFNAWRNWARFERKKQIDAIKNAVIEMQ